MFFVVHTPSKALETADDLSEYVELVLPMRLAELVVDAGLSKWLEAKVSQLARITMSKASDTFAQSILDAENLLRHFNTLNTKRKRQPEAALTVRV